MDPFVPALNACEFGYNLGAICIFLGGTDGSIGFRNCGIIHSNLPRWIVFAFRMIETKIYKI